MARLPAGVFVSETQVVDPSLRSYRFGFPIISTDDVRVALDGRRVASNALRVIRADDGIGGLVQFLPAAVAGTRAEVLRTGQRITISRDTEAKEAVDLPVEGLTKTASTEALQERVLRVQEEIVAALTGEVRAAVQAYLAENPILGPIPDPQVNSDWDATEGVAAILNKPTIPAAQVNSDWDATTGVAEILNKPAELDLNAEGPTWMTSGLLPTTVLAEEGIIWPWDGTMRDARGNPDNLGPTVWTLGAAGSGNNAGQIMHPGRYPAARVSNSFLALQPDQLPPEAIGIWVIAEQNRNAAGVADSTPAGNWVTEGKVMLPLGPGAGVQDSAGGVSGTEAILTTGYNRSSQHTIEVNYYAWEPRGHLTIALRGDGNAPPANVRLRIAPAGVYGTGLVGPRGPKGDPGTGVVVQPPVYASLSLLPASPTAAGDRAYVLNGTESVMEFYAINATTWRCLAGSSGDLVNANIDVTLSGTPSRTRFISQVASGSTLPASGNLPAWDFRFPYQLINVGAAQSDEGPTVIWWRIATKLIEDLPAAAAGDAWTSRNAIYLNTLDIQQRAEHARPGRERLNINVEHRLGRTSTNGILVSAAHEEEDYYPLRIRGSS